MQVTSISRNCILFFPTISLFVILTNAAAASKSSQCPSHIADKIQECVNPVAQYAKVLNQRHQSNNSEQSSQNEFGQALQLPKLGGQVFTELCRLIRDFETCVEGFRAVCPKHITINLIEASYGYLCNAGYSTFMNSAECLMELDRKPAVKQCHDETLRDIEKANSEIAIAMPAKLNRMCEALNFFSGCVRHPIRHNCGNQAWQVIFRVLKDTTKTLMPACEFTGTSPKIPHRSRLTTTTTTTTTTTATPKSLGPVVLSAIEDKGFYNREVSSRGEQDRRTSSRSGLDSQDVGDRRAHSLQNEKYSPFESEHASLNDAKPLSVALVFYVTLAYFLY